MEKKTTATKTETKSSRASSRRTVNKTKKRNYSPAAIVLLLLSLLEAFMLFLPSFGGAEASSMINVLKAKDLYSVAVGALLCLPLGIMLIALVLPVDVIKKYVICFFMTVWMLFGYLLISLLFKSKFSSANPSAGLIMGILFALLLFAATIIGNITDKASKKHKDNIWYNGFNKIILFISLPLFVSLAVAVIVFRHLIFSLPIYPLIGIFAAIATLAICAFISICSLFGKNRPGILYYIAAVTSVVSVMGLFIMSDSAAMIIALVFAAVLALFFIYLGHIAKRTYF